jgi:hypothetical protein
MRHRADSRVRSTLCAARSRRLAALLLPLLAPTLAGCGTVVTHRDRHELVHRVRVETPGASATVDVNGQASADPTPTQVKLRTIVLREELLDRSRRSWGYAGLILTPLWVAGGILLGATANGLGNLFRSEDQREDFAAPYLVGAMLAAALSFGLGLYALSTATTTKERRLSPAQEIGLRSASWSGRQVLQLRCADGSARLEQIKGVIFDVGRSRWRLIGNTDGLRMRARHEALVGAAPASAPTTTPATAPASTPAAVPAPRSQPTSQSSPESSAAATAGQPSIGGARRRRDDAAHRPDRRRRPRGADRRLARAAQQSAGGKATSR